MDNCAGPLSCSLGNKHERTTRASTIINRVKSSSVNGKTTKQKSLEPFQEQVHICGSLSSSASSSGCSSVESTLIELPSSSSLSPPQVQGQGQQRERFQDFNQFPDLKITTDRDRRAVDRLVDDEDGGWLELNEALYLRRPRIRSPHVDIPNLNGCCMINGCGGRICPENKFASERGQFDPTNVDSKSNGSEMSEFSAFTLQKSLTIARSTSKGCNNSRPTMLQQTTCSRSIKQAKTVRRSSTVKIVPTSNSAYCCCCSGDCGTTVGQEKVSSMSNDGRKKSTEKAGSPVNTSAQLPIDNSKRKPTSSLSTALLRRATIIGQPLNSASHQSITVASSSESKSIGRADGIKLAKVALNRVQRPQIRRPLPVPPPVVPLYKEIALFGGNQKVRTPVESTAHSNVDSRQESGGSIITHLDSLQSSQKSNVCDEQKVEINNFVLDNLPKSITSHKNNSSFSTYACQSLNNIDKLSERFHPEQQSYQTFTDLLDDDDNEKQRFYQENWQNLDSLNRSPSNNSQFGALRKGMANSCAYFPQASLGKSSQENVKQVASSDAFSSDNKTVSGNNFSSTLGRKTGKFLEKLRQSFITNFNRSAANTNTVTTTTTISTSPEAVDQVVGSLNNTDSSERSTFRRDSSEVEKDVYKEFFESSDIYDTPEYDGRQWFSGSVDVSEQKLSRPATRPCMPPPPPPAPPLPQYPLSCQPTVEALQRVMPLNCASIKPRSLHEPNGACVDDFTELGTALTEFKSFTQIKSIQSSSEHEINKETSSNHNKEQLNEQQQIREKEKISLINKEYSERGEEKCSADRGCCLEERGSSLRESIISGKVVKTKRRKAVQFADDSTETFSIPSSREESNPQADVRSETLVTFGQNLQAGKDPEEEETSVRGEGKKSIKGRDFHSTKDEAAFCSKFNPQKSEQTRNNLAGGILLSRSDSKVNSKTRFAHLSNERIEVYDVEKGEKKAKVGDIKMGSSQSVAIEAEDKSSRSTTKTTKRTAKTINFAPATLEKNQLSNSHNGTNTTYIGNPMKKISSLTERLAVGEISKLKPNSHKEPKPTNETQVLRQQQQQQQDQPKQIVCSKFKLEGKLVDATTATSTSPTAATSALTVASVSTTISTKIKRCNASITANTSFSSANQAQSMSTLAGTGTNMTSSRNLPLEDSLEKRRKSIQNGDVFIYPSLYKDLNECSKCARDNKICNCTVEDAEKAEDDSTRGGNENNIEPCSRLEPTISTSTNALKSSTTGKPQTTSTTVAAREASIIKTANPTKFAPSSKSDQVESPASLSNSNNSPKLTDCKYLPTEEAGNINRHIISNAEQQQQHNTAQQKHHNRQFSQDPNQQHSSFLDRQQTNSQLGKQDYHWNQHSKTVYKISIAAASIDQKSNQLRLSSPKIIVPSNNSLRNLPEHSQLDSNLASSSSSFSFDFSSSSSASSPLINICPPVPPRGTRNSSDSSSNETVNEYSPDTKKACADLVKSSINSHIISTQQQSNSPNYHNTAVSNSGTLNTCNNSSEQSNRTSSPIIAIAVNGATAHPALDKNLSGDSVKKLDQRSTLLLENIYHHYDLSNNDGNTDGKDSLSSSNSTTFQQPTSQQTDDNLLTTKDNSIYCNDERPNPNKSSVVAATTSQSNNLEAKITAISIGSPTHSPPSIDLEKILPPLLVTKCERDSDKNGKSNNDKEAREISIDSNNNNANQNLKNLDGFFKEENSSSNEPKQQQLTYNLKIGDAIKITSTSICISSSKQSPLSTYSPLRGSADLNLTSVIPIEPSTSRRRNINNKLSRQAIHEDDDFDLSYTPSSNTSTTIYTNPTTAVATTYPVPCLTSQNILMSDLINTDKDSNGKIIVTDETCTNINNNDVLEYSPILTGVRDYIKNVNTELQVKTSTASPINGELALVTSHSSDASTEIVMNPKALSESINSKVANLSQANFGTVHKTIELESPKKSIFDGASKDEILEYLEDARERVPEILMAADDVMVISENELIVVNQLDPGSPATPISIVEATEVVKSKSCNSNSIVSNNSVAHPDKLRQHLQEMFQANFDSKNETTDDETNTFSDQQSGLPSSIGAARSMTSQIGESRLESNRRICNDLMTFSGATGETLDSFDDQVSNVSDIQKLDNDVQSNSQQHALRDGRSSRQSVRTTTSSLSNTSNTSVGEVMNSSNLMSYSPSTMYTGRRNSTSETSPNTRARSSVLQMMMLQHRYSNRDSLSSSSSSPPSSVSPSSTSSNQTSGNCSAASTFYASSSLSSSSPLLAISNMASTNSPSIIRTSINNNINKTATNNCRSVVTLQPSDLMNVQPKVDRDDSGLCTDFNDKKIKAKSVSILQDASNISSQSDNLGQNTTNNRAPSNVEICSTKLDSDSNVKLSVIDELGKQHQLSSARISATSNPVVRFKPPTFASSANLMSRTSHGRYTTMSRLNYYFMNRHPSDNDSETIIDFQCLDCDQFIDVDQSTMSSKSNEIRLLQESDAESMAINSAIENGPSKDKPLTMDQLDRAYIAAMNGLPLCKTCEKKRIERKEIISEFVETELKYGRDLKIIHDEFYRPMRIAGLLSKDQINGVFLNLEELIIAHCKFADRLEAAIREAHLMEDVDYNTVNIGRLFVGSAEMLSAFECYCIRQGSAACLLARLAKEKELLRIFLRVSQMENTLLRRMNLAAFLMVPVQRVTKYPLLLNRLYKVTAYHHKDREALRDAQLKVELHLEHINQQTKGFGSTNKIWRRISNLSAPISNRRGLINAEDIGYIKLRKTAMDMLKWDRDETQFIHSGRINFAPLNEYLTKQKMKPIRYMSAHALLVVLGKPNWKYRPDLVKANLDNKLMTPTPGGNGIKETALLLFREKNGRFLPCREPLFLSNCVLSNDCCQYNNECPLNQTNHHHNSSKSNLSGTNSNTNNARKVLTSSAPIDCKDSMNRQRTSSSDSNGNQQSSIDLSGSKAKTYEVSGDSVSMSSLKSLPEDQASLSALSSPPSVAHTSRSFSLASALPRTTITAAGSSLNFTKPTSTPPSSNLTIINQLMTKVNNYHKQSMSGNKAPTVEQQQTKVPNPASLPPTTPSKTTTTSGMQLTSSLSVCSDMNQSANINSQQPQHHTSATDSSSVFNNVRAIGGTNSNKTNNNNNNNNNTSEIHQQYNHYYFHNHHQPYGDYEESFEIHERLSKESMLLRADTPLKTRYWLQMLRYHAKDLGQWRVRRNGLANIMMMRQD